MADKQNIQRKPGWLCGAAADLSGGMRAVFTVLLALIAAGLCFSQLGIMSWGDELEGALNAVFLLVPAALAVAMLGVVPGLAVGMVTGVLLMARAQWSPTSYFDMYLSDPMLSIAPVVVGVALMAAVVTPCARKWRSDQGADVGKWKRISVSCIASIVVGCLLLSACFSFGARGGAYLLLPGFFDMDPVFRDAYLASFANAHVLAEALLNTAILSVVCVGSELLDANRRAGSWESSVSSVFSRWLLLAMAVVFMLASAVSFCVETVRADRATAEALENELDYVQQQIDYNLAQNAPIDNVLNGYTAKYGGTVAVVRNYQIVTTNNPALSDSPVMGTLVEYSGEFDELVEQKDRFTVFDTESRTYEVMKTRKHSPYVLVVFAPLPETYAQRTTTLLYNTAFFLLLLAVVFIVARRLLRNVVVAPIHRTNDTLGLITEGDLRRRVDERKVVEFDALSTGINTTVAALKDSISEAEQRNAQELATAKAIQESSLPTEFPAFPNIDAFDIYASMKTAREVGGDFYDFFEIEGARKVGFVVADVSGKGVPAALFMMTAKTQIRTYLESGLPVAEAVDAANHQLCLGNDEGMFVTMLACTLDYDTGRVDYVNAGHNPPLLLHDGAWKWLRDVSGMPLGLFDGLPYEAFSLALSANDVLYLYTDGVTEAMDQEGALFGEARLEGTLARYADMNPRSVCVGVRRAITDFTKDCEQSDDITMLALKYGVPPEEKAVMILDARDDQLVHVNNYIHAELHRRHAPKSVYNPLDIAAEELFINVCHYAYPDATPEHPGEVRILFEYEANPPSLTVQIADDGVPYNPLAKPDAVTPDDIADVPIGGLGILMAKRSVDEMTYDRVDGSNVLTFRKGW